MSRKIALSLLTVILFGIVSLAQAQQLRKMPRVGYLGWGRLSHLNSPGTLVFRAKLRDLGWVEGENVIIEWRFAQGVEERVHQSIADFIRLRVDAMVLTGGRPLHIAKKATHTIPIVMMEANHPVRTGLIDSLARPGGNITGMTSVRHELDGKRIEILKEIISGLSHVAVLWQSTRPTVKQAFPRTELAAKQLGIKLQFLGVKSSSEIANAFEAIPRDRTTGLLAVHTQLISANRKQIVKMAAKKRIPSIFPDRRYAILGGLLSYGSNNLAIYAQSATYVDKILNGANPAELPVERPTKFDLVINLKTANQIGVRIPGEVLRWADEVIQ